MRILRIVVLALLATLALAAAAAASDHTEIKTQAADAAGADRFGLSAGASFDLAVIGSPYDDPSGSNSGAAYIIYADGSQTKLTAANGLRDDNFGYSVAIDGSRVVVGAWRADAQGADSGAAYLFEADGSGDWNETMLLPEGLAAGDRFGTSVAVSGNRILVGAPNRDTGGAADTGAAFLFEADGTGGWTATELTASDGVSLDNFGSSVAIAGDTAAIGAVGADAGTTNTGAAYAYRFDGSGWSEDKLVASDAGPSDFLGVSVGVSAGRVLVGSYYDDDHGPNAGAAYVFTPTASGWAETKLTASDGAGGDNLGRSAAISGDRIVLGAPGDDDAGANSGAAYLFVLEGGAWVETKFTASDAAGADTFGMGVGVSPRLVVAGSPDDDDAGTDSGAAYLYEEPLTDTDADGIADDTDNCPTTTNPNQTDTDADGIGDECDPLTDTDADGIADDTDNCPTTTNPNQTDTDADGIGDECDTHTVDSDGDGLADSVDPYPFDHDNDSVSDADDVCPGTIIPDPHVPTVELGWYRWAMADDDLDFDTRNRPWRWKAKSKWKRWHVPQRTFTIADTGGCNASQIAEELRLHRRHVRYGLSQGALIRWIRSLP